MYVTLTPFEGTNIQRRVHVILGKMFIENPNPELYNVIGHKDNIKWNNELSNLYWTSTQENTQKAVDDNIFVFDAGLKYDNDLNLGIDYIIPNFDYLIKNKKNIKGIFLTHGHEGNMGAIPDILEQIPEVPVYATKLTIKMVKNDMEKFHIIFLLSFFRNLLKNKEL